MTPGPGSDRTDETTTDREEIVVRRGDLEIEENMTAQRRLWTVQRIGRGLALLVLALALAGLFGRGPLSHKTLSRGGHELQYERIGQRDGSQVYRVRLESGIARSGKVSIWIDRETVGRMRLEQIVPEPEGSTLGTDRVTFEFEVGESSGQVEVRFDFQPTEAGYYTARIGVEDGPTFEVKQLVLP